MAVFEPRLRGAKVALFIDYQFEDMEVMYPKLRLEEEGASVVVMGAHPAGTKYTGKHGYPVPSDLCVADLDISQFDGILIPGGFAPDYMRRSAHMLSAITTALGAGIPTATICHGPWMLCSARTADGKPVASGRKCTSLAAIKDDLINAGAAWVDEAVVVDGPLITSRTPKDLTPFCHAIIQAIQARVMLKG